MTLVAVAAMLASIIVLGRAPRAQSTPCFSLSLNWAAIPVRWNADSELELSGRREECPPELAQSPECGVEKQRDRNERLSRRRLLRAMAVGELGVRLQTGPYALSE